MTLNKDYVPCGWEDCPQCRSWYAERALACARCRGKVKEFTVPNDVWNAVVRRGGPESVGEYLCEACYRHAVEDYVREWRAWAEYAQRRFREETGKDLQAELLEAS